MPILWFWNTISYWKKTGPIGEMADSRCGAWDVQDEPRIFCHIRWQGSYQKLPGSCQKDSSTNGRGSLWPKGEKLRGNKSNDSNDSKPIKYEEYMSLWWLK